MTSASRNATVASSSVAGANCAMSCSTGRCEAIECRDRRAAGRCRKIRYRCHSGRSRPHLARHSATTALVRGGDVAELRQHRIARHGIGDQEDHERREDRHDHRDRKPRDDVARQGSGAPARGGDRTRRYRCNCAQPIPPDRRHGGGSRPAAVRFRLNMPAKIRSDQMAPGRAVAPKHEERHAASLPDAQPRHAAQLLRRARRRGAQGGGRGRHQPDRAGARRRGADRPRARLRDRRLGPPDAGFRRVLRARARARRLPALRRRHPQRRRGGREPQRASWSRAQRRALRRRSRSSGSG